jgi:hypothetical protein
LPAATGLTALGNWSDWSKRRCCNARFCLLHDRVRLCVDPEKRQYTFWRLRWGKNQSAAMAGKIPKPSDVDAFNISRPTVQQLSTEHQKVLNDIRQKIREEKEKEIQKLEEEAMKQYISHFSIDHQGKGTMDAAFDASQFEVKIDENEQPVLNSEIANDIDNAVSSHVNNMLDFVGQKFVVCLMTALAE